jgi:hypothetical protein
MSLFRVDAPGSKDHTCRDSGGHGGDNGALQHINWDSLCFMKLLTCRISGLKAMLSDGKAQWMGESTRPTLMLKAPVSRRDAASAQTA